LLQIPTSSQLRKFALLGASLSSMVYQRGNIMGGNFYYSLLIFYDGYVEILNTYPSLNLCLKAKEIIGEGVCIEISFLKGFNL